MAEVLIQNLRDPDQMVNVIVTINKVVIPEEGSGGPVWVIEAATKAKDANGDPVGPIRRSVSSKDTFTTDVNAVIDELCALIDWNYTADTDPPEISSIWPPAGSTGISVDTDIRVNLLEEAPSSGIDLSSIEVLVKGIDLTDQVTIEGDMRSCLVRVVPGTKYKSAVFE